MGARLPRFPVLSGPRAVRRRAATRVAGLLTAAVLGVGGCSSLFGSPVVKTDTVRLEVRADANDNSPVAVDIVAAFSPAMLNRLLGTDAAEWFKDKDTFLVNFPTDLKVESWELVPGQVVEDATLPDDLDDATGLLVFARYAGQAPYRARIDHFEEVTVILETNRFTFQTPS